MMGFIHDPTWRQLLGLAALFTAILGVLEAYRGRVVVSRYSDAATVLSSALLLMWLAATVAMIMCLGLIAGASAGAASIVCGVGFMKLASALGGAAGMQFRGKLALRQASEDVQAILAALEDSNVQIVLNELNVTEASLRDLYEELVRQGLGVSAAESALTDAQFLRAYFDGNSSNEVRRDELHRWLSRLQKAA